MVFIKKHKGVFYKFYPKQQNKKEHMRIAAIFIFVGIVSIWQQNNAMNCDITGKRNLLGQEFFVPDKKYTCVCKNKATSLSHAAENGCAFCCLFWLNEKKNYVNGISDYSSSPLYLAAYYAWSDAIQVLLMHGAVIDKEFCSWRTTPLKIAAIPLPQGDFSGKRKKSAIKVFLSWPICIAEHSSFEKRAKFLCALNNDSRSIILNLLLAIKRTCKKFPRPLRFKIVQHFLQSSFEYLYKNELVQRIWSSDEPEKEAHTCISEMAEIIKSGNWLNNEVDDFIKNL